VVPSGCCIHNLGLVRVWDMSPAWGSRRGLHQMLEKLSQPHPRDSTGLKSALPFGGALSAPRPLLECTLCSCPVHTISVGLPALALALTLTPTLTPILAGPPRTSRVQRREGRIGRWLLSCFLPGRGRQAVPWSWTEGLQVLMISPLLQGKAGELGEAGPSGEPGVPVSIHKPPLTCAHGLPYPDMCTGTLPSCPFPFLQGDVGVPGEQGEAGHRGSVVSGATQPWE
jgi:hypothetical protein